MKRISIREHKRSQAAIVGIIIGMSIGIGYVNTASLIFQYYAVIMLILLSINIGVYKSKWVRNQPYIIGGMNGISIGMGVSFLVGFLSTFNIQ